MQKIPKIFHQIWLGSELPEKFKKYQITWLDLHPDWDLRLWDESNIGELKYVDKDAYQICLNNAERSDYLRFSILLEFGGVYIDTDFECYKNITPLLDSVSFVIGKEALGSYNNAFIASTPHFFLMQEIFDTFPLQLSNTNLPSSHKIGPQFISKLINKRNQNREIRLLDGHVLYPEYWLHVRKASQKKHEIFANHHYSLSWNTNVAGRIIFKIKCQISKNIFGLSLCLFYQIVINFFRAIFFKIIRNPK